MMLAACPTTGYSELCMSACIHGSSLFTFLRLPHAKMDEVLGEARPAFEVHLSVALIALGLAVYRRPSQKSSFLPLVALCSVLCVYV